jgi:hypothetical protein
MRWEDPDYAVGEIMPGYSGQESIPEGAYTGNIQLYNNTLPPDDEEYTITNEILKKAMVEVLTTNSFSQDLET